MNEARAIDRLDASPRFTADDAARLNQTYRDVFVCVRARTRTCAVPCNDLHRRD